MVGIGANVDRDLGKSIREAGPPSRALEVAVIESGLRVRGVAVSLVAIPARS